MGSKQCEAGLLILALLAAAPALAQQEAAAAAMPAQSGDVRAAHAADKSGTNPLNLQTEFRLFNEYQGHRGGRYFNTTTFQYVQPFAQHTAAARIRLPLVATDLGGGGDFGFGDFNLRFNYVPRITHKYGILTGVETFWDTASESTLGSGRNVVAPVFVYALFLPNKALFAPAYQQFIDIGGEDTWRKINQGAFDFYYVKLVKKGWWILDPTLTLDYEGNPAVSGQVELERGFIIGPQGKGVASWYIRPGVGIGATRAYDWNLEVAYKVVGF
jgi:hypothetical protein